MALAVPSTVPVWAALFPRTISTYYVVGQRYTNSGNIYTVTTAGTTSSGAGPSTTGSGISDGSAVVAYVSTLAPAWAVTTYTAGQRVTSLGSIYQVVNPGPGATTLAGQPNFTPPASIANPLQFNTSDGYTWVWCASSSAVITTPTAYASDTGWLPGQLPPAQIMNWLFFWIYKWILYFKNLGVAEYSAIYAPGSAVSLPVGDASHNGIWVPVTTFAVNGLTANASPNFSVGEIAVGQGGVYRVAFDAWVTALATGGPHYIGAAIVVAGLNPATGNSGNSPYMPTETSWWGPTDDGVGAVPFAMTMHIEGHVTATAGQTITVWMQQTNATIIGALTVNLFSARLEIERVSN